MSKELKEKLNAFVDKLKDSNFDMGASYNNYIKKVDIIANYFSDNKANKIKEVETEKVYNMLGNELIKLMMEYREVTTETILFTLYGLMSRLEDRQDARVNSKDYINSLSNNAKKEYARLMSYSSEEMEM